MVQSGNCQAPCAYLGIWIGPRTYSRETAASDAQPPVTPISRPADMTDVTITAASTPRPL